MELLSTQSKLGKKVPMIYYIMGIIGGFYTFIQFINPHISELFALADPTPLYQLNENARHFNYYLAIVSLSQVILLTGILIGGFIILREKLKLKETERPEKACAQKSIKRLTIAVLMISFSWILLYCWLFIYWSYTESIIDNQLTGLFWTVADLFRALTAFLFFYAFTALEYPNNVNAEPLFKSKRKSNLIYAGVLSACFFLLSAAGRNDLLNLFRTGPLLLAFWGGLAMQFFFGKLDSFNLKIPRVLISPLYLYILVQIMWCLIAGILSAKETLAIIILTLILKAYFLVMFLYWLKSNAFSKYFVKTSKL